MIPQSLTLHTLFLALSITLEVIELFHLIVVFDRVIVADPEPLAASQLGLVEEVPANNVFFGAGRVFGGGWPGLSAPLRLLEGLSALDGQTL